jgi:formamidopyrimidine-DNA glycosylase
VPELPEVETVVRTIRPVVEGRTIARARILAPRIVCRGYRRLERRIPGRTILGVRRHGKHILIELSGGSFLTIHLGMTGRLLANGKPGAFTRAVFELDSGALIYDDVRQFGRIGLHDSLPDWIRRLGPDALSVSCEDFLAALRRRKARMKPLLLNQQILAGLGNIYADEALFAACIHPHALASRLSRGRAQVLYAAIRDILQRAIDSRGSSIADYVDADGREGSFQSEHKVYQRAGEPCERCGSRIRRIIMAQRSTHYCPHCQRL